MGGKLPFYLTGAFFVLSPLSAASELDAADSAKYLRLVVTALIVLFGVGSSHFARMKSASWAFMPFVAFWCISPIWSSSPGWGLFHKGMFGLTFLSGIVLGLTSRSLNVLESGLRFLGGVSAMTAVVVLFEYVRMPELSSVHGRLSVGGLNSNMLAYTAAPFAILCAYLALYGMSKTFRWIAGLGFGLLLIILLLSGSRGGIVTAATGCGVLLLPVARRPGALVLAVAVVFGFAYIGLEVVNAAEGVRAVDELTKDTRSSIWRYAVKTWLTSPLIGQGWLSQTGGAKWATVQSSYLQVLVETGALGFMILSVSMLTAAARLISTRRMVSQSPGASRVWYFGLACIGSGALNGLFESSLVVGTSLTPLLLGFGIGLVDRIPALMQSDTAARHNGVRWGWVWIPDVPEGTVGLSNMGAVRASEAVVAPAATRANP